MAFTMSKIEDLTLSDNTGAEYTFEVYRKKTEFYDVAGVYVFTKRSANQYGARHKILYIGETGSFKRRQLHSNHHKLGCATRMGLTHICVLQTNNRMSIQNRLITKYDPPLNERVG